MEAEHLFAVATFGAALQELAHWYELRAVPDVPNATPSSRSIEYWLVTLMMIAGSGAGTTVWLSGEQSQAVDARDALVFGAAFPALFKQAVRAAGSAGPAMLGTADDANHVRHTKARLIRYFRIP